ncbi:hypothetical protein GCM10010344_19120 [Streptomyces bluensis]|nr:hypothetical protein GCM10010344_19120 [Streptomyces bluensis]
MTVTVTVGAGPPGRLSSVGGVVGVGVGSGALQRGNAHDGACGGPRPARRQAPPARPAFEDEAVQADKRGSGGGSPQGRDGTGRGGGGEETPCAPQARPLRTTAPSA